MQAAQLNVRLDSSLKHAVDGVLEELGLSPSQVVRTLWEYLVVNRELPCGLRSILRQGTLDEAAVASEQSEDVEHLGADLVASYYVALGLNPREDDEACSYDYEELREISAQEKMREWGMA